MQIYYSDFDEFFIVGDYLAVLLLLTFQKIVLFIAKILLFGPAVIIYKLYMCACARNQQNEE